MDATSPTDPGIGGITNALRQVAATFAFTFFFLVANFDTNVRRNRDGAFGGRAAFATDAAVGRPSGVRVRECTSWHGSRPGS